MSPFTKRAREWLIECAKMMSAPGGVGLAYIDPEIERSLAALLEVEYKRGLIDAGPDLRSPPCSMCSEPAVWVEATLPPWAQSRLRFCNGHAADHVMGGSNYVKDDRSRAIRRVSRWSCEGETKPPKKTQHDKSCDIVVSLRRTFSFFDPPPMAKARCTCGFDDEGKD